MYLLKYSSHFKKDLKRFRSDRYTLERLGVFLDFLVSGQNIPREYSKHGLKGAFKGCYECHIKPDVLVIYKIEKTEICVLLLRIGSHSDLF